MKMKNTNSFCPDVLFIRHVIRQSYECLPVYINIVHENEKYQEL